MCTLVALAVLAGQIKKVAVCRSGRHDEGDAVLRFAKDDEDVAVNR